MALNDGFAQLGYVVDIATDGASTDAGYIDLPHNNVYITHIIAYDATGDNSSATLGVFTGAGGTGTTVVSNAALTTHTTSAIKSARTVAAPGLIATRLYFRVGTASGVAGSKISILVGGFTLQN